MQKPEGSNSIRDSMMNDKARQRAGDNSRLNNDGTRDNRLGDSVNRASQMETGTFRNLERDRAGRTEGTQRMRDQKTFQNRTTSRPSNMGSYRGGGGGGFSRGGGGGFSRGGGGGRRR